MCRVLFLHFHVQVLFLAILKMVHIASAVLVFVGTLAMFLALWSWPTTWAPNTSHNEACIPSWSYSRWRVLSARSSTYRHGTAHDMSLSTMVNRGHLA